MRRIAANYIFPVTGEPIKNGVITLEDDGTILRIGRLESEEEDTEFYNGILCPGFVNAHCHLELSHLQGRLQEATGMWGFISQIKSLRETTPREERIRAAEIQMENLYRQGVSAVADISNSEETFGIKTRSPLYSRTFIELFGSEPDKAEELLRQGVQKAGRATAQGLDTSLAPHACYSMSVLLLEATVREGLKSGFLSCHNQESPEEEELSGRNTGKPSLLYFLDHLSRVHTPTVPGKINLVHNTVTGEESIDAALQILQEPYWTICPLSNIFIHRTLPPLNLMRAKGLDICLGTDSLSSNKCLCMAEEIKCLHINFPEIPLTEILKWACLNGAKALGKENELGSLEPGKKPGIVLVSHIDWSHFKLTPDSITKRII